MVWNHVFQTSCIIPFSCSKQCKMNLKHDSLSLQLCPYSGHPFLQRVWDGKEGCVLFGGGDRGYGWGLGGWVGLFSPQRQNAPSPHPTIHSLPPGFVCPEPHSSLFCHPAIPLCLAYTMGAQCSGSWRCILPAHWGANTAKLGGGAGGEWGVILGARNTLWLNATPPTTTLTSLLALTKHIHTHTQMERSKQVPSDQTMALGRKTTLNKQVFPSRRL